MTPKQYKAALKTIGISNYKAAPWLGIALRTAQNYASGERPVPATLARLLRLVISLKLDPSKAQRLWS